METKTALRQAISNAHLVGKVSDMKLEEKVVDGIDNISGYVTVKTSDFNFVRVTVNINAVKKDGTPMKPYEGIRTVMNEYQPISVVGEDEATMVSVNANLSPYATDGAEEKIMYRSNFFTRVSKEAEPKAAFDVEMFISGLVPEVDNDGVETGRLLVKGWVPSFNNGINPITLVADESLATPITQSYDVGMTVHFWGDIINSRISYTEEMPVKIGKPQTRTVYKSKSELQIVSLSESYADDDSLEAPYDAEAIRNAIQARKEEREARRKEKIGAQKRPSAAAHGRTLGF